MTTTTKALTVMAALLVALPLSLAQAQTGTASGRGVLERADASGKTSEVAFEPRHAFAYVEGSGAKKATWIVLTEKAPPAQDWLAAKDRTEARKRWGEKEKAAFVVAKLDDKMEVDMYYISAGPGQLVTDMISTWNGLKSASVKLASKTGKRLQGTLTTGQGWCFKDNKADYCSLKSEYTFDVTLP